MVTFKNWLYSLGPGIITAALVFGPSKMTITSKLGAAYGYSLIWITVVATFFMAVYASMAARIGMATDVSLLATIRQKWNKKIAFIIGVAVFLVCGSFQAGNAIGVGIAMGEMTHTSVAMWVVVFNLIGIALLFFRAFYKILERIMIALIGVKLVAFLTTLIIVKPDVVELARGARPSIPDGSYGLVIAFTASTISLVAAFYQSYVVQERRRMDRAGEPSGQDSLTGIILLGLMSAMVMICAAAVLHPKHLDVNSATDMARALEPVFGKYASYLFLSGLFGASFSCLIGNATVGGTILGDALGYGSGLRSKVIRYLIALVMIIGATTALVFGKLPLQLIVFAQSITIFIVPVIGIAMYMVANDANIMGQWKNSLFFKIAGGIGLLLLIVLGIINIKELI